MSTTNNSRPKSPTQVVTNLVRFSFLHLFEPTSVEEDGTKKYSASILIKKTDTATLAKVEAAIKAAYESEAGQRIFGNKPMPKNLKTPLRDGDVDRPEDAAYRGCMFLNASSLTKPGVVDADVTPVLDKGEVYSGCYGRASINFYAFNVGVNKGIAAGLNNVQKLKEGEKLAGGTRAEDDFAEPLELDGKGGSDDIDDMF